VSVLRHRPELRVRIPLESYGQLVLDCDSYEDELRLRVWLRRSDALERLALVLARLLDDLDERDGMVA
jgi:hypothetical protein